MRPERHERTRSAQHPRSLSDRFGTLPVAQGKREVRSAQRLATHIENDDDPMGISIPMEPIGGLTAPRVQR
jgi:hypothetical protein